MFDETDYEIREELFKQRYEKQKRAHFRSRFWSRMFLISCYFGNAFAAAYFIGSERYGPATIHLLSSIWFLAQDFKVEL